MLKAGTNTVDVPSWPGIALDEKLVGSQRPSAIDKIRPLWAVSYDLWVSIEELIYLDEERWGDVARAQVVQKLQIGTTCEAAKGRLSDEESASVNVEREMVDTATTAVEGDHSRRDGKWRVGCRSSAPL